MTSPGKFNAEGSSAPQLGDCTTCRNKIENAPTCLAFPGGIPRPILDAEVTHKRPYPGDHGILYDPDPEKIEELKAAGWL
jgi:hypothetical protein